MHHLTCPSRLNDLDLPPPLHHFLTEQLIDLPFEGSVGRACNFWHETETQLYRIESEDTSAECQTTLDTLLELPPEMVLQAPLEHCFCLFITNGDGGGTYLIFNNTFPHPSLQAIRSEACG
ncbi:hypothetical protein [Litchfieldella xinjiangensis]|uniref:hypothetical protein n=1 Tax=Litchfieldella xinjiangensis TaxID=1166948 RepID=UPI0005BB6C2F|nr:hypothetical protein [Halomonas xinjiangensis]